MNKTIAQQLKISEFPFFIKDKNGNLIYYETSYGHWCKYGYDQNRKVIYSEASYGNITDNRPKVVELTLDEIAKKLNIDVNLLKIKK
jgi:hypothetical protein